MVATEQAPIEQAVIPRAPSNLELLSQTAAWKNDLERVIHHPARVSPTEMKGVESRDASSSTLASSAPCDSLSASSGGSGNWTEGAWKPLIRLGSNLSGGHDEEDEQKGRSFLPPFRPPQVCGPPPRIETMEPVRKEQGQTWPSPGLAPQPSDTMMEELARDNAILRHEISEKNEQIDILTKQVLQLQGQVAELRQLPVGKISQIPVADMVELMQIYGSEVSDHTHFSMSKQRKVQKASIVRQFRRWNPNFHEFFRHEGGKWVPKLGREGELERRAQNRADRRLRKVMGPGKPTLTQTKREE